MTSAHSGRSENGLQAGGTSLESSGSLSAPPEAVSQSLLSSPLSSALPSALLLSAITGDESITAPTCVEATNRSFCGIQGKRFGNKCTD